MTVEQPLGADSGVRADGATRGDKAEATALVVGGGVLLTLPFVVLLDRMAEGWFWVSVVAALGGTFILGLGVRWFATVGAPLASTAAAGHPLCGPPPVEIPINVRLVEARNRQRAHILRFVALGSAVVLLVVDVGPLKWAVVALFLVSFVADHVLLRPRRYVLDDKGLHGAGLLARKVSWEGIESVWWRYYPDDHRPPFPTSERLIVEREGGDDVEFVFHRKYGGTEGSFVVRALIPLLGDRLRVLSPRRHERQELDARVSAQLATAAGEAPESGAGDEPAESGAGDETAESGAGDEPAESGAGDEPAESGAGDEPAESGAGDEPADPAR